MNAFFSSALLLVWSICPLIGLAQEVLHDPLPPHQRYSTRSAQVFLDNDSFSGRRIGEDRNYTMGLAFGYADPAWHDRWWMAPQRHLFRLGWQLFHPKGGDFPLEPLASGWYLSNVTFTPEDLVSESPVRDDRPYANLNALDGRIRYWNPASGHSHELSIQVGALGLGISEYFQTLFHTIHPVRPIPLGWGNQIGAPIEPTALLRYQRDRYWSKDFGAEGGWMGEVRESLAGQIGYRMGLSYGWTTRIRYAWPAGQEVFTFAQIKPQFIGYDVLLMGQFRSNPHRLRFEEMEPLVVNGAIGGGLIWPVGKTHVSALYGFYWQSPEADYGPNTRHHFWGRLQVGVGF
ncbi:MAG: lipid A-modifier LpxR family protein [Bacteroidota bacterium]